MKLLVTKGQYGYYHSIKNEDYKTKEELKSLVNIRFVKCNPPTADKTMIDIKNAFFSNYKKKDGSIDNQLIVMEYDVIKEYTSNNNNETKVEQENQMQLVSDDSLPF